MHSAIFQISSEFIPKYEWIDESDAYSERYMDYCGEYRNRKENVASLVEMLEGAVTWDGGNSLVCTGDCSKLIDGWKSRITSGWHLAMANIIGWQGRWELKKSVTCPLESYLFYISGWSNCTEQSDEFVEWLASKKKGDRIYIGAVLDYHY